MHHIDETIDDPKIAIRQFESGATRNLDQSKPDMEGFTNPEVLYKFGEYMHAHRFQKDGSVRASDNWQKGIPLDVYIKSLDRHVLDLKRVHRGYVATNPDMGDAPFTIEELCCAIMFNVMGYLKETIDPAPINLPHAHP